MFTGGATLLPHKQAIRSVSDGKVIAEEIELLFRIKQKSKDCINSRLGALQEKDLEEFLKSASSDQRQEREGEIIFSKTQAKAEAARCLHCDCTKAEECKLRNLATEYNAHQKQYKQYVKRTRKFIREIDNNIIYEPGKCIKCGICVRICTKFAERQGMIFTGRSYDTEVSLPFNISITEGMGEAAAECIKQCPTGALARC